VRQGALGGFVYSRRTTGNRAELVEARATDLAHDKIDLAADVQNRAKAASRR
jgi:hypothetical protein